jgi:hypothetical protein
VPKRMGLMVTHFLRPTFLAGLNGIEGTRKLNPMANFGKWNRIPYTYIRMIH